MLLLLIPYALMVVVTALSTASEQGLKPLVSSNQADIYRYPERTARRILAPCPSNQIYLSSSCVNCQGSCLACVTDQTHCSSCPKTWQFPNPLNNLYCDYCHSVCRTCFHSSTNCTSCYVGYMLTTDNKCLAICNTNEYYHTNNSCVQCGSFCAACSDGATCVVCMPGYTLNGGTVCVRACADGFYRPSDEPLICVPCHPNCETCTDYGTCLTCTNSSAVLSEGCRRVGSTYLIGFVDGTAVQCDSTCESCSTTAAKCNSCVRGRYLQGTNCNQCNSACQYCNLSYNDCVLCRPDMVINQHYCVSSSQTCPTAKYLSTSLTCVDCHQTCSDCRDDGGGTQLYRNPKQGCPCKPGYMTQYSVCIPMNDDTNRGPDGCTGFQYRDVANSVCSNCHSSCAGCSGPLASQCIYCFGNEILYQGNCIQSMNATHYVLNGTAHMVTTCGTGSYLVASTALCAACHVNCATCSGPDIADCKSCKTNAYLNGYVGKCRCKYLMYLNDNGDCATCGQYCASCTSPTTCTECLQGYTLNGGVCGAGCLTNQFASYTWSSPVPTCIICDISCTTCSGASSSECTSCQPGQTLSNGICSGLVSCPSGQVLDSGICKPCHKSCSKCTGLSATSCLECNGSRIFVLSNNSCSSNCAPNQYVYDFECINCHSSCATCDGNSSTNCLTCPTGKNKVAGACVATNCGWNQFFDGTGCSYCSAPCSTCEITGSTCNDCVTGYIKSGTSCTPTPCNSSSIYQNGSCQPCHPSCKNCTGTSPNQCDHCVNNLAPNNNLCYCMTGYLEISNYTCQACPLFCATCTSSTSCTGCQIGYSLVSGICSIQCAVNQYQINAAACGSCDTSCLACSNSGPTSCTSCAPTLTFVQGRCLSPSSHCITAMIAGRELICQVCESGYQVSDLGQCALPVTCSLPSMIFGGECVGPTQGKASFNDGSGVFSVAFDREMRLVNNSALVSSLFKVTVLDRSGKTFDSVSVDETKLSADGKALDTHLTIGANLINGSVMIEQKDKSQVVLYSSGGYLDPKSTPKTSVTKIADAATATLTSAAGAISSVAGPVASAALVAATPLSATSGTLLEKVSNFFQFLVVLNGRELYLPQTILDAVGISLIPPIFDNYMQIDEDTVSCQPPSKYVQNQQSCNMLNNYGKELQFIALITVIVGVITCANYFAKRLKPESMIRKCLTPIAASFGPAYVVIVFEGSNLEMTGVSLLHLRTAFASKCQSVSMVAAMGLLALNISVVYYAWVFTRDLLPKLPSIAAKYSIAQKEAEEAERKLKAAKKALSSSAEGLDPELIAGSINSKRELKTLLEEFEVECRNCKAGLLAFLLDGYHPNAMRRAMFVPLANLLRNTVSQVIVVFLADLGQSQVWLALVVQTGYTVFRASVKPRRDHSEDYVDIVSHGLFSLYIALVAIVNQGVPEETAQDKFGLVMSGVLVSIALINILFIIFVIGKSIYNLIKEALSLLSKKKGTRTSPELTEKSISPNDSSLAPLTVERRIKKQGIGINHSDKKKNSSRVKEPTDTSKRPETGIVKLKSISDQSDLTAKRLPRSTSSTQKSRTSKQKVPEAINRITPVKSQTNGSSTNTTKSSVLRNRNQEILSTASATVFTLKSKRI